MEPLPPPRRSTPNEGANSSHHSEVSQMLTSSAGSSSSASKSSRRQIKKGIQQHSTRLLKRKLTAEDNEPPPRPKKVAQRRSSSLSVLVGSSSSLSSEPIGPDSPSRSVAEIKEAHERAGLEYPPPKYNLEGKWNTNKATGVRGSIQPLKDLRALTKPPSVAIILTRQGNHFPSLIICHTLMSKENNSAISLFK